MADIRAGSQQIRIDSSSTVNTPERIAVPTGGSALMILASDSNMKGYVIQNAGLAPIYLGLDYASTSTGTYHVCLAKCSADNDGSGGIFSEESLKVAVYAIASPSYGVESGYCTILKAS